MASDLQSFIVEGRLGADPEIKYVTNKGKETAVANFRMAHNDTWTTAGGEKTTQVTWFKVAVWGSLAEIVAKYVGKGGRVIVTGKLRPGPDGSPVVYQKKDGEYAASYEITAEKINIIDFKATDEAISRDEDTDEIPF